MKQKYKDWVEEKVEDPYLNCIYYSELMTLDFPELKVVRGYYEDIINGMIPHWWLVDEEGDIVDPTHSQLNGLCIKELYHEYDESQDKPTGKCKNCGEFCYDNNMVCSDKCKNEFLEHLNGVWR